MSEADDLAGVAPEEMAAYLDFRGRVRGANIDERTLQTTDYVNHFSGVIMLLEIIPDAPECLEEALQWGPLSYVDHLRGSGFKDKALAIEASSTFPPCI